MTKDAFLNVRIARADRELLSRVAQMERMSLTTFVLKAAFERAEAVLQENSATRCDAESMDVSE